MQDKELWDELEEFPNYMISNRGQIYHMRHREMRTLVKNQQGIIMVRLIHKQYSATRSLALLVAKTFIPNEDPRFNTPIHLDGNRENCNAANLVWRPRPFAIQYHRQFGTPDFHLPGCPVAVVQTQERFEDSREASIKYGLLRNHVIISTTNCTPVFPTGQEFMIIK